MSEDDELEPLITECPGCHTRFRVSEAVLARASGKVRCGACLTVFNGVEHLTLESAQLYADEDQARRALDDLLDELAGEGGAETGKARPGTEAPVPERLPTESAEPSRTLPPGPIFSGFEEPEPAGPQPGGSKGEPQPQAEPEPGPEPVPGTGPAEQETLNYAFQVLAESAADASGDGGAVVAGSQRETGSAAVKPDMAAASAGTAPPSAGATADAAANAPSSAATDTTTNAGANAAATAAEAEAPRPSVVFGEQRARRPLVWLAIVLGVVALVAQVLWYRFDDWARDPAWRGVYAPLCRVLGCELPVLRDRSKLTTRNLAVRTHPEIPDMLVVNAVIVNQAEFAQPFPVLELRFTTVRGILVAGRRFEPEEYLAGEAEGMDRIPPRTPVQVELTIEDPGPDAVNYFLRLL